MDFLTSQSRPYHNEDDKQVYVDNPTIDPFYQDVTAKCTAIKNGVTTDADVIINETATEVYNKIVTIKTDPAWSGDAVLVALLDDVLTNITDHVTTPLGALKTSNNTRVNTQFATAGGYANSTTISKIAVIDKILEDKRAAITAVRAYHCTRCGGEGRYPLSQDTNDPADTDLIGCQTCEEYEATIEADQAVPQAMTWYTP